MRVVLAMSGGVDSSASAYLLKEQGHEVIGLFMRSGATEETACATAPSGLSGGLPVLNPKSHKQGCCSASDAADARRVADVLDIPFHALNFKDAFGRIKDYFADEYLAGRTPNPCVMCNNWLKFGKLWEFAEQVGADRIATGHYAQLRPVAEFPTIRAERHDPNPGEAQRPNSGEFGYGDDPCAVRPNAHSPSATESPSHCLTDARPPLPENAADLGVRQAVAQVPALLRGLDSTKDQSYVLFGIRRDLLDKILFPVGGYTKEQIRERSRAAGLRVADKPDSQEICFIPDHDYAAFIGRHRGGGEKETAGELVDTAGHVVGRHDGYEKFTIGQRRGLGVTFGAPRFVVRIDPESKQVVIGEKADLARHEFEADRLNWLVDGLPTRFTCRAQIRYQHRAADAEVEIRDEDRLRVRFQEPQFGVAPGQAVVLYDGPRVLGGGWIR